MNENLDKFFNYLVDTYVSEDALFPSKTWARMTVDFYKETTNACEAFHTHFGKEFYHSHFHIFRFVSVLLNVKVSTYIKIRSCDPRGQKIRQLFVSIQQ